MGDSVRVGYDPQMFSFFARSGVAKYFAQLACSISRFGWEPYFPFQFSINQHYFELGGRQLWRIPTVRGGKRLCRMLNRYGQVDRTRFAVWHSTFYDTEFLDVYGAQGMVTTVHDMIPEILPQYFKTNPHEGKARYVQEAKRIIAISKHTRDDICKLYGIESSKIDVVYHGVDISTNNIKPIRLPDDYILFIGAREGYKNFNRLLEAYAKLAKKHEGVKLVCIGVRGFSSEEEKEIKRLGLSGVIHKTADDAGMRYALKHARAFVYPSIYEGFGIPIVEAMANGCPLVIANASCFPEIARDAAIYFDPYDTESIEYALDRALIDRQLNRKNVDIGEMLAKEYSLDRMLSETAQVYERSRV